MNKLLVNMESISKDCAQVEVACAACVLPWLRLSVASAACDGSRISAPTARGSRSSLGA